MSFEWAEHNSISLSVLRLLLQGLSETVIRYLIILKAKFGANFVTSFSWQKMSKLEKVISRNFTG